MPLLLLPYITLNAEGHLVAPSVAEMQLWIGCISAVSMIEPEVEEVRCSFTAPWILPPALDFCCIYD
jgi:hypothetical protein